MSDGRHAVPLVIVVAGLASTYAELILVLVPGVALLALVRSRAGLLARLNRVAGCWALGAVLAPWAWVWLAQSARIGGRFSEGSTPFDGKSGLELLRTVIGVQVGSVGATAAVTTVLACVAAGLLLLGLVGVVTLSAARGAALGCLAILGWLVWSAHTSGAGNLEYRTAQFGTAFVLVFAVLGLHALLQRRVLRPAPTRAVAVVLVVAVVGTSAASLASAAAHLPRERAEVQHVPEDELAEALSWVREHDPEDVAVLVPRFTDLLWLALALRPDEGVAFPVVPAVYLGSFPRWDRQPDRYQLLGVGAATNDEVRVLHRNERYQLVELEGEGVVASPFQPTYGWARTTYMRGLPCARNGAQLLLAQGNERSGTFTVATPVTSDGRSAVRLSVDRVEALAKVGDPVTIDGWTLQEYRVPAFDTAIVDVRLSAAAQAAGATAVPLLIGGDALSSALSEVDDGLVEFCATDTDEYMDGYDANLTLMRRLDPSPSG
jgi:hypothetical protein